jgi:hypothetical protein
MPETMQPNTHFAGVFYFDLLMNPKQGNINIRQVVCCERKGGPPEKFAGIVMSPGGITLDWLYSYILLSTAGVCFCLDERIFCRGGVCHRQSAIDPDCPNP